MSDWKKRYLSSDQELFSIIDINDFKSECEKQNFKKNENLTSAGHIYTDLFYLEKGLVCCINFQDKRTLWFEMEKNFFTCAQSFIYGTRSGKEIKCLEAGRVYRLDKSRLRALCEGSAKWSKWWIRLLEHEYVKLQFFQEELLHKSAADRYHLLLEMMPDLSSRIPLKNIASFLGISQVSLSRIRAGKQ
ncbi:MAG: Crp/Fnr family transcriptional regulator [Balneolaceae bacterium]|jgi:CRP-like cAMP-binding protein